MPDKPYAAAAYEDMPDRWDGFARLVRPGLGITAFGCNIMDIPPNFTTKSHDESESGQEELYVGITGSGAVIIDAEDLHLPLESDHAVRVSPGCARRLTAGPEGLRVLIVGGVPGGVYEPPEWSSVE